MNLRQNLKGNPVLFMSEIDVFKDFNVLKIYKSIVIENCKSMPLFPNKYGPSKVFAKLCKSLLLTVNKFELIAGN